MYNSDPTVAYTNTTQCKYSPSDSFVFVRAVDTLQGTSGHIMLTFPRPA